MKLFLIIILILLLPTFGESADEYKLKSVFIERFSKFIEWNIKESTLNLGIVGNSKATKEFKRHFKKRKIKNKKVNIKEITELSQLTNIDLIFIVNESKWKTSEICSNSNINALIIGNESQMAKDGASISFFIDKKRLRFKINRESEKKHNIKISSYLLEMAEIVTPRKVEIVNESN